MPEENREHEIVVEVMSAVQDLAETKVEVISVREEVVEVHLVKEEQAAVVNEAAVEETEAVVREARAEIVREARVVEIARGDLVEAAVEEGNRNKYHLKEVGKAYLCRTFFKKS